MVLRASVAHDSFQEGEKVSLGESTVCPEWLTDDAVAYLVREDGRTSCRILGLKSQNQGSTSTDSLVIDSDDGLPTSLWVDTLRGIIIWLAYDPRRSRSSVRLIDRRREVVACAEVDSRRPASVSAGAYGICVVADGRVQLLRYDSEEADLKVVSRDISPAGMTAFNAVVLDGSVALACRDPSGNHLLVRRPSTGGARRDVLELEPHWKIVRMARLGLQEAAIAIHVSTLIPPATNHVLNVDRWDLEAWSLGHRISTFAPVSPIVDHNPGENSYRMINADPASDELRGRTLVLQGGSGSPFNDIGTNGAVRFHLERGGAVVVLWPKSRPGEPEDWSARVGAVVGRALEDDEIVAVWGMPEFTSASGRTNESQPLAAHVVTFSHVRRSEDESLELTPAGGRIAISSVLIHGQPARERVKRFCQLLHAWYSLHGASTVKGSS
jgi:hypothetical protein